ncbi:MAG: zf-HC2 domain-containing protein [Planctomycetota bacterium]|nr:zf-HC2 domain-containing protein [Planctomycetota bacterium]
MKHEGFRELLALRLYDELDGRESELLDEHLRGCAACADFARELESGLGALRKAVREDLPADWDRSLRESVAPRTRRTEPWRTVVVFAAGLAAGLALMAVLRGSGSAAPGAPMSPGAPESGNELAAVTTNAGPTNVLPEHLGDPPPRATAPGRLTQLGAILRSQ